MLFHCNMASIRRVVVFVIIFLDMSPRRPALLICSGIPNPAGLIITPVSMRIDVHYLVVSNKFGPSSPT